MLGGAASTSMTKCVLLFFFKYYYRQNKLKEILTVGAMQEVGEVKVKRRIVKGLFLCSHICGRLSFFFPSHIRCMCTSHPYSRGHKGTHSTDMDGCSTHADRSVEENSIVQETGSLNRVSERGWTRLKRAVPRSSSWWCYWWYLWMWAGHERLVGVVCWGLRELRIGLGLGFWGGRVKWVGLGGASWLLGFRTR